MSWRSKYLLVLWCATAGCSGGNDDDVGDADAATDTVPAVARVQPLATPEAAGVLTALSAGAAEAAAAALPDVTTSELRRLLNVVRSDHEALQKELAAITDSLQLVPAEHPSVARVRAATRAALPAPVDSMAPVPAASDQAVLERQIELHTALLAVLDSTVLPGLEPSLVAEYARAMRPAVAAHLQRAHQIEALLRQQPVVARPAATPSATPSAPVEATPPAPAPAEPAVLDTTPPPPPPDTTGSARAPARG